MHSNTVDVHSGDRAKEVAPLGLRFEKDREESWDRKQHGLRIVRRKTDLVMSYPLRDLRESDIKELEFWLDGPELSELKNLLKSWDGRSRTWKEAEGKKE